MNLYTGCVIDLNLNQNFVKLAERWFGLVNLTKLLLSRS